ncbi:LuxR C-terminal-related transcriptional regulator [Actinoplanes sp. NPDC000266]
MSALENIAATARDGAGHQAAARALELAADLTADDGLRARWLRRAAVDAHLSGDEPSARKLLTAADRIEPGADRTEPGADGIEPGADGIEPGADAGGPHADGDVGPCDGGADPRVPTAYAYAMAGRTGIARVAIQSLLGELRARGSVRHLPAALAVAAFVELQEGRLEATLRLGGEALLLSGLAGDALAGRRARQVVATVRAIRGEALPHISDLSDIGAGRCSAIVARHRRDWSAWSADLLEAHVRTGWRPSGEQTAELIGRARAATDPLPAAVAARSVALVAAEDGYAAWFETALRHHAAIRCPFELGRTRLAYGERLRRSGLRVRARAQLRAAAGLFDGLAAAPWSARARAELSATAAEPGRDAGHGLTPQESHVARAVATGQTNREVAAALFLSSKTVEFHLGNIYRKLGVRNRTQLAQRYRRAS